jgi:hypothetical protein
MRRQPARAAHAGTDTRMHAPQGAAAALRGRAVHAPAVRSAHERPDLLVRRALGILEANLAVVVGGVEQELNGDALQLRASRQARVSALQSAEAASPWRAHAARPSRRSYGAEAHARRTHAEALQLNAPPHALFARCLPRRTSVSSGCQNRISST